MNTKLEGGTNNKDKGVKCVVSGPNGSQTLESDVVLLSIGRKPYTEGLELSKAGL
jgi:dihydrolipoamide dehydrogenase